MFTLEGKWCALLSINYILFFCLMSRILGISAFYHDSAAALVGQWQHCRCCSRRTLYSNQARPCVFSINVVQCCLEEADIEPEDLDYVVFYDRPLEALPPEKHSKIEPIPETGIFTLFDSGAGFPFFQGPILGRAIHQNNVKAGKIEEFFGKAGTDNAHTVGVFCFYDLSLGFCS